MAIMEFTAMARVSGRSKLLLRCFARFAAAVVAVLLVVLQTSGDVSGSESSTGKESGADRINKVTQTSATDSTNDQKDVKDSVDIESDSPDDRIPLVILGVGIVIVLGLIIGLKVNAFIALITAAIVVSLLAPGEWSEKISRVASSFGAHTGGIGIVIALAAVIGQCMLDSGAADRVVRAFLRLFGEKRATVALTGSGFVLAIPVFFDTVFYLLVPLARSLHRKTGKHYLKYILAIGAGGAITHTLVPPTPGPLMMASNLGFDVGMMIMVGAAVAFPAAIVGVIMAGIADRLMPIPMRQIGNEPDPEPLPDEKLPSLWLSLAPVLLPVVLISTNTVLTTLADGEHAALLTAEDVPQFESFRDRLRTESSADGENVGKHVFTVLKAASADEEEDEQQTDKNEEDSTKESGPSASKTAELLRRTGPLSEEERDDAISGLNKYVLGHKEFYQDDAFLGIKINETGKRLLGKGRLRMKLVDAERMNRALLESAYPKLIEPQVWETSKRKAANISAVFGNANLALLFSAVIAMWVLVRQRGLDRVELARVVEKSLMSAGVIILITAGGGAFGDMLKAAHVGDAIKGLFDVSHGAGLTFLVLGFAIASVLKIAQGSSTVAMITGSAMLASIAQPETLGFHPAYLACAIGSGSLAGSWMNDSGFWIFAKMGGLTESEALKSWTLVLIGLAATSFAMTVLLAKYMPLI